MKKKRFITLTVIIMAVFVLVGWGQQVVAAPKAIKIKALTFLNTNNPNCTIFHNFRDAINERLKGKVVIDYAGGPEVIPGRQQIEALRNGVIGMSLNMAGASRGVVPEFIALMPSMMTVTELRESGYLPMIDKAARKRANITYLAHMSDSFKFYLFWNKEVKDPRTGFKGMKIRGGGTYNPGIKKLGGEPISIAVPELYSAMQRGVVDGMAQPLVGILGTPGLEKTVKYGHIMRLIGGGAELFMNLDQWNAIPEDLQKEITAIAIEAEQAAVKYYEEIDNKMIKLMKDAGVKFVDWGTEGNEYFESVWADGLWEDMKKLFPDTLPKFKEIAAKYKK